MKNCEKADNNRPLDMEALTLEQVEKANGGVGFNTAGFNDVNLNTAGFNGCNLTRRTSGDPMVTRTASNDAILTRRTKILRYPVQSGKL